MVFDVFAFHVITAVTFWFFLDKIKYFFEEKGDSLYFVLLNFQTPKKSMGVSITLIPWDFNGYAYRFKMYDNIILKLSLKECGNQLCMSHEFPYTSQFFGLSHRTRPLNLINLKIGLAKIHERCTLYYNKKWNAQT